MDQRIIQLLFALLSSAIYGPKLTEEEHAIYAPSALQPLLKISSNHDLERIQRRNCHPVHSVSHRLQQLRRRLQGLRFYLLVREIRLSKN